MVEGMEFQERSMRFNVMEGNLMVALNTASFGFDVVDLHYWMTHQIHKRMPDGIHWTQDAVRLQLNIILTHFCLSRNLKLPGRWGGKRNRPLESAKRIAEAARPLSVSKEAPPSKRQKVEEEFLKRPREEEEEDSKPSKRMRTDDVKSNTGDDCFDVVVVKEATVPRCGTKVEARLINGLSMVGKEVRLSQPSVISPEKWEVVPGGRCELVRPGGMVTVVVRCNKERLVLRTGDLVAQAVLWNK